MAKTTRDGLKTYELCGEVDNGQGTATLESVCYNVTRLEIATDHCITVCQDCYDANAEQEGWLK